jgi:Putative F0F1-ATPase subunit Ca2+/Mg2+ transporter
MTDKKPNPYFLLSFASNLGFSMAIPLIIFIGGGIWLDNKFDISPLLTLIGAFLGIVSSGYSVYKSLKPYLNKEE